MRWMVVPPVVMGCGLLLMFGGYVWPWVMGTRMYSEEQAKELGLARARLHSATYAYDAAQHHESVEEPPRPGARVLHTHGGGDKSLEQAKAELDQAQQEYDAANAELKSAHGWRSTPATLLWWLGATLAAVGVAGHFVLKTSWGQQFAEQ